MRTKRTRRTGLLLSSCVLGGAVVSCGVETSEPGSIHQGIAFGDGPAPIPGRVEAEDYDVGGIGIAYNDTTPGNSGGQHRAEDVDIEVSSQGGYNVGWIAAGEWLDYTVDVASAGTYSVKLSVASLSAGGTVHLEVGGVDVSGPISFEATGGWQEWTEVEVSGVTLPAGVSELRLVADSSSFNVDWLEFASEGRAQAPFSGTPVSIPGRIEAENYDLGGPGVAYEDSTSGNSGGAYRTDDVDIEVSSLGGHNVGWIAQGEWLEYSVSAPSAGTYDLVVSVASLSAGGSLHLEVGGQNVSGPISFGATGGWQTWAQVQVSGVSLPAGNSVIRLVSDGSSFNVDWFELGSSTSDPTCSTGILNDAETACCDAGCGSCGGFGCDTRPGGAAACCAGNIQSAGALCSGNLPPCVMDGGTAPPPAGNGNISPLLVGNNVWFNPSGAVWDAIAPAGLRIIRIGGHQYDDNFPSHSQLTAWVNEIKALGAEPMIQVSQYRTAQQAADTVRFFNIQTGNTVKYWNVGNEPWLQAGRPPTSTVAPMVEGYVKPIASAMKSVDPSIKIFAPDASWFIDVMYEALLGGAHDIAGRDSNGNFYIDGISWHRYTEAGDLADDLRGSIQRARELVDRANSLHGRTGEDALQFGIGEFNANAGGGGPCTFTLGQQVARVYGSMMEYGGTYATLWSMKEGGSSCSGTDFGFLNGNNSPRPSFYHMQMISHNFSGNYADGDTNQGSLHAFGAVDTNANKIAVMLVNSGGSKSCNVRLNDDGVGGTCQVNISAGRAVTYSQSIPANTSMVLLFNLQGQLTKRITYTSGGIPVEQNF